MKALNPEHSILNKEGRDPAAEGRPRSSPALAEGRPTGPESYLDRKTAPVGRLAYPVECISISSPVRKAKELLGEEKPLNALVVMNGDRPVGLIMSLHLDRTLSRQYGIALYYDEPVSRCMDSTPLILEASTPLEAAARRAMGREPLHIYDHIIVTREEGPPGVVSMWQIIDALAFLQQIRSEELDVVNRRLLAEVEEKENAKKALAARAEELVRSNQDLQQFAYFVSHDLQEPLRAVRGFMQLLERRCRDCLDDKALEYISRSQNAALRMGGMINDLLAFSRVETKGREFEVADLGEALSLALENLDTSINETNAQITVGPLPTVKADRVQMTLLFQNLIGNAVKFRGPAAPEIQVSSQSSDGFHQVSVSDRGLGFDQEQAERIFSFFQRLHTRDQYPGTGIGLAVCKRIVERHGGTIWAESAKGRGAVFHFKIPMIPGEPIT